MNPDTFAQSVERLSRERAAAFITGIERYRNHPYYRDLPEPAILWSDGTTRLLDYAPDCGGRPILIVPSLINRHYILDLKADSSFVRWLAGAGFRPFIVDWGVPGEAERGFSLTDYICQRLEPALDRVTDVGSLPPAIIGYCMGGLLALGLAVRNQDAVSGLALLATPWDFHAEAPEQARAMATIGAGLESQLQFFGELPTDLLQTLFSGLDPLLAERKFVGFAALEPKSEEAVSFVALEDWVNDGVPLAAPVARECFAQWYGANSPARGEWRIEDEKVDPSNFKKPSLVVTPSSDRIVPPKSAAALGEALPNAALLRPAAGHIGMIVGRRAETKVWRPVADWLRALS
ncbi:MAG: alpha/beta fold hydrolase [Proteobacteria bacterium]|nr:alpha/beta fold hydrolase [Pseudomonadota bacterium]